MKRLTAVLLLAFLFIGCLLGSGCTSRLPDYSGEAAYTALFDGKEDAIKKELKNFIIRQFRFFNDEQIEEYVGNYDWDEADRKAFVNSYRETNETMRTEKTIGTLTAVYLEGNEDQAQVGGLVCTVITDRASGAVLANYSNEIVFTMRKSQGKWLILTEENKEYYDFD